MVISGYIKSESQTVLMNIALIVILFINTLTTTDIATCQNDCKQQCTSQQSYACIECLLLYNQRYDNKQNVCRCINNLIEYPGYQGNCCPKGCKSCTRDGCIVCWNHANLVFSDDLKLYICICEQEYYLNSQTQRCHCKSQLQPQNYYYDQQIHQCYKCPIGCNCTSRGCQQCQVSSKRMVRLNKYQISTCSCMGVLVEINQTCSCPIPCSCSTFKIYNCTSSQPQQNLRINVYGSWQCLPNYEQKNGKCVCSDQKMRSQIWTPDDHYSCECSSKYEQMQNQVYEYGGICYSCDPYCKCDKSGCYFCEDNPYIESVNNLCTCKENYTMTTLSCFCTLPFYQDYDSDDELICRCLSDIHPQKYYYNNQSKSCLKCPKNCICSQNGCISCQQHSLRTNIKLQNNKFYCPCIKNAYETEYNQCLCDIMFIYSQSSGTCECQVSKIDFTFQDSNNQTCRTCPDGCLCDNSGCFSCDSSTQREISINSEGRYTCYCSFGTTEQPGGLCGCVPPLTYDSENSVCLCSDPYYQDYFGECVCKSEIYPKKYYYDPRDFKCYNCPFGCVCNIRGCVQCSSDSLRFILPLVDEVSICPCFGTSFLVDNKCTICSSTQYYYSGQCIPCSQCKSCDKRGCLSCYQGMDLENFTCICRRPNRVNRNSMCLCVSGFFSTTPGSYCHKCPVYCKNCFIGNNEDVVCNDCYQNVNRRNNSLGYCECVPGFQQSFPISKFCCPLGCSSCNQSACNSCNVFSHKILVDNRCVCRSGMMQIDYKCYCPNGTYLLQEVCNVCPQNCKTCEFNYVKLQIQCSSCYQGVNRVVNSSTCQCLTDYKQTSPVASTFCVLLLCELQEINCTKCKQPFVMNQNRQCECLAGMYKSILNTCESCSIHEGCLDCSIPTVCLQCNQSQNYYLSFYKCIKQNVFDFVQTSNQEAIAIQFNPPTPIIDIINIERIIVNPIYSKTIRELNQIIPQIFIDQFDISATDGVITLNYNTTKPSPYCVVGIYGTFLDSQNKQKQQKYNITMHLPAEISPLTQSQITGLKILGAISLTVGYALHLFGFKHNQLIFFIQTLVFSGFHINKDLKPNIYFAHNLRYVYYNFGHHILQFLLQKNYIEESSGNYNILTQDSNILRVAGIPLILAAVNIIFLFMILLFSAVDTGLISHIKMTRYSRYVLRTFQFIYKSTMYPLIYFSVQMIVTWSRSSFINSQFVLVSNIVSCVILVIFVIATVAQYFSILTSNLYKMQSLNDLTSCFICSVSLVLCGQKYWIFLAIAVVLGRKIFYYWMRQIYLNDDAFKRPFNYVNSCLQIILLVLMLFSIQLRVLISFLTVLIVTEVVVSLKIIHNHNHYSEVDKQKGYIQGDIVSRAEFNQLQNQQ